MVADTSNTLVNTSYKDLMVYFTTKMFINDFLENDVVLEILFK